MSPVVSSAHASVPAVDEGAVSSSASTRPSGSLHNISPARLHGVKGRPDPVAVGVIVWLASELMFFAALFAAYFTLRDVTTSRSPAGEPTLWENGASFLNVPYALVFTFILVMSSVTCQLGVMAAEKGHVKRRGGMLNIARWGMREWYILTFVMGAVFIAGQITEYAQLIGHGLTIYSDAYGSVFFLATGFHGLHVLGGLVAFLLVLGRTYMARTFTHEQAVNAVVVSYYWHFVDAIWVILFGVIYWLQ